MELISVIIPTYNRIKTLEKCINSVLKQTYNNFEIIICDDGSSDSSRDLVESYQDQRIIWIEGEHSGLPSIPRNRALSQAKGEWIAFLDSDDEWMPEKLEKQLMALRILKKDCLACCTNAIVYSTNRSRNGKDFYIRSKNKIVDLNSISHVNILITSSVILHKSILRMTGFFPSSKKLIVGEDYALWLRVATFTNILYIDELLVKYSDNPNSSIRQFSKSIIKQKIAILFNYCSWAFKNSIQYQVIVVVIKNIILIYYLNEYSFKLNKIKNLLKEKIYKIKIKLLHLFLSKKKLLRKIDHIKVSVIIPVFNAADFLEESIKSIINQSHKNFELIIINDGSTDNSLNLVNCFNDDRIIIYSNKINLGVAESLNIGLNLSKGKYIARMDADDFSHPDRLFWQIVSMEINPDVGVLGGFININSPGDNYFNKTHKYPISHGEIVAYILFANPLAHPSVIFRAELKGSCELKYRNEFLGFEDWELWFRLSNITKFKNLPKVLVNYRTYPSRINHLKYPNREALQINFINKTLKENNISYSFLDQSKKISRIQFYKKLLYFNSNFGPGYMNSKFVLSEKIGLKCLNNYIVNEIIGNNIGIMDSLIFYSKLSNFKNYIFFINVVKIFKNKLLKNINKFNN